MNVFSPAQTRAVEQIVRDYLISHPDVMLEALTALDAHQKEAESKRQGAIIAELSETLYDDPDTFVGGNPKGDVTIVEFFDYKCGYCKRALDTLLKVVEEDGNIRLILKEFPILGTESVKASEAAIASLPQGRYLDFHIGLLRAKGTLDEARIMEIAAESGLDTGKLREAMKSPKVQSVIERSYMLADRIGVNGTPAFIIGGKLAPGAPSEDRLRELVSEARTSCVSC